MPLAYVINIKFYIINVNEKNHSKFLYISLFILEYIGIYKYTYSKNELNNIRSRQQIKCFDNGVSKSHIVRVYMYTYIFNVMLYISIVLHNLFFI